MRDTEMVVQRSVFIDPSTDDAGNDTANSAGSVIDIYASATTAQAGHAPLARPCGTHTVVAP